MTPSIRTTVPMPIRIACGEAIIGTVTSFHGLSDKAEHIAFDLRRDRATIPLVRLHSECLTGDVLGSLRCDCGPQLTESLNHLADRGGVLLYLRQEGRGIGLYNKLDAYQLQDEGYDTFAANAKLGRKPDERSYRAASEMLQCMSVGRFDLLTNNPDKAQQLRDKGASIRNVIPTGVHANNFNVNYLHAKAHITTHSIQLPEEV